MTNTTMNRARLYEDCFLSVDTCAVSCRRAKTISRAFYGLLGIVALAGCRALQKAKGPGELTETPTPTGHSQSIYLKLNPNFRR